MTARGRDRVGGCRRLLDVVVLIALVAPPVALAQTTSPHDMGSMPGMTMEAPKGEAGDDKSTEPNARSRKASKPAKPRPLPASPSSAATVEATPQPAPQMDQGNMPGMNHDMPGMTHAMPGMRSPATDQDAPPAMEHSVMPGMDHGSMPGMDHGSMPGMDHGAMPGMAPGTMPGTTATPPGVTGGMQGMDMGSTMDSMQGGSPPADARDPDTYADGLENGHMPGMDMADDATHVYVLLDRVEQFHSSRANGQAVDAQAWAGGDIDKLWLKVDGERDRGRLGATRTEALWDHSISTFWGLQTGARHDFGDGPGRTWASFGLQGLSPYWFDVQATAYVGQSGRTALRFEAEYELLLTQRLVLQPDVKIDLYGKNDAERDIGAGLSSLEAGLRLRYDLSRKFGPYVGVVWNRKIANTAGYAREVGNAVEETRVVAGIHFWF